MHSFTPVSALVGGALIGASASLFLLTHGRVAGISGLFGGLLSRPCPDASDRVAFLAGLGVVGLVAPWVAPSALDSAWLPSLPLAAIAGVLVGIGTTFGSGCTSGHGVCGLSRFSVRSLVATLTFMLTGFATVFVVRHWLVGSP